MIPIALVGIGGYGWNLVELLEEASADIPLSLAAAADTPVADLGDRAQRLRGRGVRLFDNAMEMLRQCRGECLAVYVATGIPTHAALTAAALAQGYHVYLEKPPAATVQEVDRMIQAARRANRFCLVGFQGVYSPEMALLQDRIAAGRMGRVRTVTCCAGWPRDRAYYTRNTWAGRLRADGEWVLDGPATNALAHQITHMLLLAGPKTGQYATPVAVRAELYAAGPVESHDTAAIEIHTAQGPTLYWLGSHCTRENFGPVIEVAADDGQAVWRFGREVTVTYADGSRESRPGGDGRPEMLRSFAQALSTGQESHIRCTLDDARKFVLALDGAHESSGRVHRIGPDFCSRLDEGTDKARTVLAGLDDSLRAAAQGPCLFSDLEPRPAWAVQTTPYDLAGYACFPRRFTCD